MSQSLNNQPDRLTGSSVVAASMTLAALEALTRSCHLLAGGQIGIVVDSGFQPWSLATPAAARIFTCGLQRLHVHARTLPFLGKRQLKKAALVSDFLA